MSRNLVAHCDVYRDGNLWVVLETGMPEDAVQIGTGETLREAYDAREGTPIQSTGRDSGRLSALTWAHNQGWITVTVCQLDRFTVEVEDTDDVPAGERAGIVERATNAFRAAERSAYLASSPDAE